MSELTLDQATAQALTALTAAGCTLPRVRTWLGLQPIGAREKLTTDVQVQAGDYDKAMRALLCAFPDAYACSGNDRTGIRFYRFSGRTVALA